MKVIHLTAYGNPAQNLVMVEVSESNAPSASEALVRISGPCSRRWRRVTIPHPPNPLSLRHQLIERRAYGATWFTWPNGCANLMCWWWSCDSSAQANLI
jgi:hypothetical protein